VSGCSGTLSGNIYTTGAVTANCTVSVSFEEDTGTHTVTPSAGANGSISPSSPQTVNHGETVSFTLTPDEDYRIFASGCGGTLSGNIYTTAPITADCTVTVKFRNSSEILPAVYNFLL
jgi:hypothetical protein